MQYVNENIPNTRIYQYCNNYYTSENISNDTGF